MSKQKDLIRVFNFLAEYLKEEPVVNEPVINPLVEEPVGVTEETKEPTVKLFDTDEVLELMRKVEEIQKVKSKFDEPLMRKSLPEDQRDVEVSSNTEKTTVSE
jgi:type IV secretory pathway ATPase VirB11/archaellum biosynthesis ATPase